jgi:uncharacterized protein (TIGR02453 family)
MEKKETFTGYSKQTIAFFNNLEVNNSKQWFESNRDIYENHVLPEAQNFVSEIGKRLQKEISSDITAIPKIDKSIFRLYRDVRFSKNKDPYKTHLGIFFWEGPHKKIENPGFYFQLNAREIFFGVGLHIFSKTALSQWRQALDDKKMAAEFNRVNSNILNKNKSYQVEGKHYKQIPRGFDKDHAQKDWLLFNGLAYMYREDLSDMVSSHDLADFTFGIFKDMSSIHYWLQKMILL